MPKKGFYVVWKGRKPGIYKTWEDCSEQVFKFEDGKYKKFDTYEDAVFAFHHPEQFLIAQKSFKNTQSSYQKNIIATPSEGICVDGAYSSATKIGEYQGIDLKNNQQVFHRGDFEESSNNLMEFLAIVHALAFCKQNNLPTLPIYSDSRTAIQWVKNKRTASTIPRSENNKRTFHFIDKAIIWLQQNDFSNPILKWETEQWGENPADFGRK